MHFEIFLMPFLFSIIFQGWFMSIRHTEITFLEGAIQSFIAKILFILYAFVLLILADILGMSLIWILNNISFLEYLGDAFFGIIAFFLYFSLGFALIVYVVSQIEFYFFRKKWIEVNPKDLRRTVVIANTIIFAFAFIIVILSKEYM